MTTHNKNSNNPAVPVSPVNQLRHPGSLSGLTSSFTASSDGATSFTQLPSINPARNNIVAPKSSTNGGGPTGAGTKENLVFNTPHHLPPTAAAASFAVAAAEDAKTRRVPKKGTESSSSGKKQRNIYGDSNNNNSNADSAKKHQQQDAGGGVGAQRRRDDDVKNDNDDDDDDDDGSLGVVTCASSVGGGGGGKHQQRHHRHRGGAQDADDDDEGRTPNAPWHAASWSSPPAVQWFYAQVVSSTMSPDDTLHDILRKLSSAGNFCGGPLVLALGVRWLQQGYSLVAGILFVLIGVFLMAQHFYVRWFKAATAAHATVFLCVLFALEFTLGVFQPTYPLFAIVYVLHLSVVLQPRWPVLLLVVFSAGLLVTMWNSNVFSFYLLLAQRNCAPEDFVVPSQFGAQHFADFAAAMVNEELSRWQDNISIYSSLPGENERHRCVLQAVMKYHRNTSDSLSSSNNNNGRSYSSPASSECRSTFMGWFATSAAPPPPSMVPGFDVVAFCCLAGIVLLIYLETVGYMHVLGRNVRFSKLLRSVATFLGSAAASPAASSSSSSSSSSRSLSASDKATTDYSRALLVFFGVDSSVPGNVDSALDQLRKQRKEYVRQERARLRMVAAAANSSVTRNNSDLRNSNNNNKAPEGGINNGAGGRSPTSGGAGAAPAASSGVDIEESSFGATESVNAITDAETTSSQTRTTGRDSSENDDAEDNDDESEGDDDEEHGKEQLSKNGPAPTVVVDVVIGGGGDEDDENNPVKSNNNNNNQEQPHLSEEKTLANKAFQRLSHALAAVLLTVQQVVSVNLSETLWLQQRVRSAAALKTTLQPTAAARHDDEEEDEDDDDEDRDHLGAVAGVGMERGPRKYRKISDDQDDGDNDDNIICTDDDDAGRRSHHHHHRHHYRAGALIIGANRRERLAVIQQTAPELRVVSLVAVRLQNLPQLAARLAPHMVRRCYREVEQAVEAELRRHGGVMVPRLGPSDGCWGGVYGWPVPCSADEGAALACATALRISAAVETVLEQLGQALLVHERESPRCASSGGANGRRDDVAGPPILRVVMSVVNGPAALGFVGCPVQVYHENLTSAAAAASSSNSKRMQSPPSPVILAQQQQQSEAADASSRQQQQQQQQQQDDRPAPPSVAGHLTACVMGPVATLALRLLSMPQQQQLQQQRASSSRHHKLASGNATNGDFSSHCRIMVTCDVLEMASIFSSTPACSEHKFCAIPIGFAQRTPSGGYLLRTSLRRAAATALFVSDSDDDFQNARDGGGDSEMEDEDDDTFAPLASSSSHHLPSQQQQNLLVLQLLGIVHKSLQKHSILATSGSSFFDSLDEGHLAHVHTKNPPSFAPAATASATAAAGPNISSTVQVNRKSDSSAGSSNDGYHRDTPFNEAMLVMMSGSGSPEMQGQSVEGSPLTPLSQPGGEPTSVSGAADAVIITLTTTATTAAGGNATNNNNNNNNNKNNNKGTAATGAGAAAAATGTTAGGASAAASAGATSSKLTTLWAKRSDDAEIPVTLLGALRCSRVVSSSIHFLLHACACRRLCIDASLYAEIVLPVDKAFHCEQRGDFAGAAELYSSCFKAAFAFPLLSGQGLTRRFFEIRHLATSEQAKKKLGKKYTLKRAPPRKC